jgi:membrane-associated phospholipid phosphatase
MSILDSLLSLILANDLLKSALLGACFCCVWNRAGSADELQSTRKKLLIALIAALMTLAGTTVISHLVVHPRPYLLAHRAYRLVENELQEFPRLDYRQPLDNRSQARLRAMEQGEIPSNDLASFPSDHAGFFVCLAAGIGLAAWRVGAIALTWTVAAIVFGKVMLAMHSPLEVGTGMLMAVFSLLFCYAFARDLFATTLARVVNWTTRYPAVAAAVLFVALFEVCSTMEHTKELLAAIGRRI